MEIKNLPDKFIEFEKEYNLLDRRIDGVYFWKLVRGRVYTNIQKDHGILRSSGHTVAQAAGEKVRDFLRYCLSAFLNALTPFPRADVLVVTHPRKVLIDGEYQDIYSGWLIERLKEQHDNFLLLDVPLNWSTHPMKLGPNMRKIESFTIIPKVFYKFFGRNHLYKNEEMVHISKRLKECFGSDGQVIREAYEQINIFKADYKHYLKLLGRVQPKKIWIVIGYGNHALIAAARHRGIETEEIQHSLISRHHMNYSFGGREEVPYFPDRMCLFGRFWYDIAQLPLNKDQIDYYVHPIRRHKAGGIRESKNDKIMFLTQPIITKYIVAFIEKMVASRLFDGYQIIVKLHPSEYRDWREREPELARFAGQGFVKVVDSFEVPLYDWFREADTVIGVASTSVFEALYFGCDVFLLRTPSIKWIGELENIFPPPVETAEELHELLVSAYRNCFNVDDIFYKG